MEGRGGYLDVKAYFLVSKDTHTVMSGQSIDRWTITVKAPGFVCPELVLKYWWKNRIILPAAQCWPSKRVKERETSLSPVTTKRSSTTRLHWLVWSCTLHCAKQESTIFLDVRLSFSSMMALWDKIMISKSLKSSHHIHFKKINGTYYIYRYVAWCINCCELYLYWPRLVMWTFY